MKTLILLTLITALVGCGKNPNANPIKPVNPKAPGPCYDVTNGNWQSVSTPGYKLALADTCVGASSAYCNEVFTANPQSNGTVILITTQTNGGPECLPLGSTTCTVAILPNQNNNQIAVDCGGGRQITNNFNRF